jgi:hypothetical protein
MALDENNLLLDIMGVPKVWSSLFVWPTRSFEQPECVVCLVFSRSKLTLGMSTASLFRSHHPHWFVRLVPVGCFILLFLIVRCHLNYFETINETTFTMHRSHFKVS